MQLNRMYFTCTYDTREVLFRQVFEDVERVLPTFGTEEEWTSDTRERDDERCIEPHVHTCTYIYIHIYTWADVRSREREGPTADTAPKWIIHEERASERGHAGAPPYHVRGTPLPREWDVGPRNLYTAITRHAVIILLLMPNILARTDAESAQGWEGDSSPDFEESNRHCGSGRDGPRLIP